MTMGSIGTTYNSKAIRLSRQLREDIRAGLYRPGALLPAESDLTKRYGVSRATIRRAVGVLAGEGELVRLPNRGVVVPEAGSALAGLVQVAFVTAALTGEVTPYVRGLTAALDAERYALASYTITGGLANYPRVIETVLRVRPAALALQAIPPEDCTIDGALIAKSRIPTVVIGQHPVPGLSCDRVTDSPFEAGRLMGRFIVSRGCRRPVLVSLTPRRINEPMIAGLRLELELGGRELPDDRIHLVTAPSGWADPPDPYVDAERATARLIAAGLDCDVLIGGHDYPTVGALRALLRAGIKVPQEVKVISAMRCAVEGVSPLRLTTIDVHREQQGHVAGQLLARRMDGRGGEVEVHYVSCELVEGETT